MIIHVNVCACVCVCVSDSRNFLYCYHSYAPYLGDVYTQYWIECCSFRILPLILAWTTSRKNFKELLNRSKRPSHPSDQFTCKIYQHLCWASWLNIYCPLLTMAQGVRRLKTRTSWSHPSRLAIAGDCSSPARTGRSECFRVPRFLLIVRTYVWYCI